MVKKQNNIRKTTEARNLCVKVIIKFLEDGPVSGFFIVCFYYAITSP